METEVYTHEAYDEAYRRYEDPYNVQIANAMISYGNAHMTSYDHAYATAPATHGQSHHYPPSPTLSESSNPSLRSNYPEQTNYSSQVTSYEAMTPEDYHYYTHTEVKGELTYQECNYIHMTPNSDDQSLPSVLEDMKPDLNNNPTLFPPLSPDDINLILRPPNLGLSYEQESDLPDDVRSLCLNRVAWYGENIDSICTDDGYISDTSPYTPSRDQSPPHCDVTIHNQPEWLKNDVFKPCPTSESSDDGLSADEWAEKPRKQKRVNRGQAKNSKLLWQFVVDLMVDPRCRHLADWVDRDEGVFRFIQSAEVARLWGEEKGNPEMNYEKMSRALRYYYSRKILVRVDGRRLVYKFGPKSKGWRKHELMPGYQCQG